MSNGFYYLEVAHVKGKGCKGPDIKENCLKLCGPVCKFGKAKGKSD